MRLAAGSEIHIADKWSNLSKIGYCLADNIFIMDSNYKVSKDFEQTDAATANGNTTSPERRIGPKSFLVIPRIPPM